MQYTLAPYQDKCVDDCRAAIGYGYKNICVVMGCGGGKSVIAADISKNAEKYNTKVLFLVHRRELCKQIEKTFRKHEVNMDLCKIGSMRKTALHLDDVTPPDLIIVDEAHHIGANSYLDILDRFPEACVIGFTATPVRMHEGGLGKVFNKLIPTVTTKWLIEHGYLAPFIMFGPAVTDTSKLHTNHGEFDRQEVEELMDQGVIFGDAVKKWKEYAEGKKTIVYCSSVNTSKKTAAAYLAAGIPAAHLDAKTPINERDEIVQKFRDGEITVLCNVDLFGEGFDVPNCECVQLLRPTKSLTVFIQQSMRAMRIDPENPDKVAIILDHVQNNVRHGRPDTEHNWSLDPKRRKQQVEVSVKCCPHCFAIALREETVCPVCGYDFATAEAKERQEKQKIEDVEFHEIKSAEDRAKELKSYKNSTCWEDLEIFRKKFGNKFAWSLHKAVEMGIYIPVKYAYQVQVILGYSYYSRFK